MPFRGTWSVWGQPVGASHSYCYSVLGLLLPVPSPWQFQCNAQTKYPLRAAGAERAFMEHLYCDRMKTAFRFLYTNRYRFYICICIYIYVPPGSSLLNTMPNIETYIHTYMYILIFQKHTKLHLLCSQWICRKLLGSLEWSHFLMIGDGAVGYLAVVFICGSANSLSDQVPEAAGDVWGGGWRWSEQANYEENPLGVWTAKACIHFWTSKFCQTTQK